jgi:hypothetical protein
MNQMTENDFGEVDRAALNRSIELTLAENDPGRVEQVKSMLAENGWWSTASFCASHRQSIALGLKPWQTPPCDADESDVANQHEHAAAKLLRRMISHGVSRYDPDPITAIEATRTK